MTKLFYIHTFGCQMNTYDSERVSESLIDRGWELTSYPENSDLIIINSCSVREKPLQKLFSYAGRFLPIRHKNGTRIFIMGCVAQQLGEEIVEKASYIDGVFGPGAEYLIPDIAEQDVFPFISTDKDLLERQEIFPNTARKPLFNTISSFLTIMHGCNNFCSYCIVPYVRGKEVSRSADIILEEIKQLTNQGLQEITLLGQNVNSYFDHIKQFDFSDLLYYISEYTSIKRLRFVTSHPKDFNEKLAKCFSDIDILMPYLHLPAQSGSNRILSKMKRGYNIESYLEKINIARSYSPDISISSDFIVGFPGETVKDFDATMILLEKVGYDVIFAFNYSSRPLTSAADLQEDLTEKQKLERLNKLLNKQKNILKTVRSRFLDRTVDVLIESKSPKGNSFMGRSEHNLIVHALQSTENDVGKIITVKINEILENTLRGDKL